MIPWEAIRLDLAPSGELRLLLHGAITATARRLPDGCVRIAAAPDAPEWARNLVEEALHERLRLAALVEEGWATTIRTLTPPISAVDFCPGGWECPMDPSGACNR